MNNTVNDKIIFIDDDKHSFGENGLLRAIAKKQAETNNLEPIFLCTLEAIAQLIDYPETYQNIALIAHDWEIDDFWSKEATPSFTVEQSIAYFKALGMKICVFTSAPEKVSVSDIRVFKKNAWKEMFEYAKKNTPDKSSSIEESNILLHM